MKTFMAKPSEIQPKWYVVDAEDMALGRLASKVAMILKGKHKPEFTPHVDTGDHVIVINCEKILLTGNKLQDKNYKYYTGFMGGLREIKYEKMMEEKPEFVIEKAVKGMLPKNSLGRQMFKKLRVYKGSQHGQEAQKPEVLDLRSMR